MAWTAAYLLSNGRFVRGAAGGDVPYDPGTEALTTTDRAPDHIRERFDAGSPSHRRPATGPEMTEANNAVRQLLGTSVLNRAEILAMIEFVQRTHLDRVPTPTERANARNEYLGILSAILS